MRLADRSASRASNNFNALRLLAAGLVVISHSYPLTGYVEPKFCRQLVGTIGVAIFFSISGYLVAKSWDGDPRPWHYIIKRALRLLPGLFVVILLLGLVVGPLLSDLSLFAYFKHLAVYRFIGQESVLYTFSGGSLPGVFTHNPYPGTIDGSLWTLPLEALAYVGAACLGAFGALRGRRRLSLVSLLVLTVLISPVVDNRAISIPGPLHPILPEALYFWALFNAGSVLYAYRERIVLRWGIFALLLVACVALGQTSWFYVGSLVFIPYGVLVLAYRTSPDLAILTAPGDVSYGVYIYAFPVQQVIARLWGRGLGPAGMLTLSLVPVYLLALVSWRTIESPALKLKQRFTARAVHPNSFPPPPISGG